MDESIVKVRALEGWHTAIITCFAIKGKVDGDEGTAEDGATVDEALCEVSARGCGIIKRLLLIAASECLLKHRFNCRPRGRSGLEETLESILLRGRLVEAADCCVADRGRLPEGRGDAKGSP